VRNNLTSLVKKINVTACLILISLLNILDAFFTLFWVEYGIAEEANPLMKTALSYGNLNFVFIKISIVTAGCYLLYKFQNKLSAKVFSFIGLAIYSCLLVYHITGFFLFIN